MDQDEFVMINNCTLIMEYKYLFKQNRVLGSELLKDGFKKAYIL